MAKSKMNKIGVSLDDLYLKRRRALDRALERVVEIYMKGEDAHADELNNALDVLAVSHREFQFS
jgi:predicted RecB family endonuclease